MGKNEQAQTAEERTDADQETLDPDFEKGFAEADDAVVAPDGEDTPSAPPKETPAEPAAPAATEKTTEKPTETPAAPAAPVVPAVEVPPAKELTALEKAEAEGAKLSTPAGDADPGTPAPVAPVKAAAPEEKSVLELLPPAYKDAGDIIKTEAFTKWFESQPAHIQKLGVSGGVDGACAVLDFYRAHASKTVQTAAASASPAAAKRILSELGDFEMTQEDGTKVKVSEYLKDMGDMGEAIAVIASQVAGRNQPKSAPDPRIEQLQSELAELRWWDQVTSEHSDAKKIVKSQAWKDWSAGTTESVKRLLQSGNPEHAVLAIDAFKESQVAAARSKQVAGGKDRTNALHSETVRGSGAANKAKVADDFESGFEAGAR